jgi:hypothetical protein
VKNNKLMLGALFLLLASLAAHADSLTIGTPADAYDLPPKTKPSPNLGGTLVNFDSLADSTSPVSTLTTQGVTFSSPDGLEVEPYSTQSGPNYLVDTSAAGSADLTIKLSAGTDGIGVGIADSDENASGVPVTIFLQALNASGTPFGTLFSVTIPETGNNPGNGYFIIGDASSDLYGLVITQPVSNASLYSGLAIDDVQTAPEPSSILLLATGLVMFGSLGLIRRKRA